MDEGADEAGGRGGAGTPYAGLPVAWEHTGDGEFPYRATVDGAELVVRVNDFPAEPLYSLLVNGRTAVDLEDWPERWRRPAARRGIPNLGGTNRTSRARLWQKLGIPLNRDK